MFVSVDGEATTKDGAYGLLATSQGFYIANRQGLTTEECLDFLLALPTPKNAKKSEAPIYVGFAIDYDVNMILGDLPLKGQRDDGTPIPGTIEELRKNGATYWRGYRISYYHRKIFRVSRGKRTFTLYDTWGYFQSSFERALLAWNIPVPAIITEGKAARGSFHRWSMKKLREYNNAELAQHVQLMNELRDAIDPLNLKVISWHGPAALAGYWLSSNKVKKFQGDEQPNVQDAAGRAYFGGRIDVRGYGFVEPAYHFDIVSAYPSATRYLPDLSKLAWRRVRKLTGEQLYVARIRWSVPEGTIWPPFPWRNAQGSIRFPVEGEGWYWKPEIEAARDMFGDCFEVLEAYVATGKIEYPLRNLIEETFAHRAKLKREGNPSHVPVKLILNSIYGKFAQTVGTATYHNLVWAGLITAHTRAKMMRAIDEDTVLVMTDSLWSTKKPNVEESDALGGWEGGTEKRLAVAEAGLYQAWREDGESTIWQRGFDKANPVDIERLVREWLDGDDLYEPVYNVHRFIGMGLASMTHYPWREWRTIERAIHPVPLVGTTKRYPNLPHHVGIREGDFMTLPPRDWDEDECSYPYKNATINLDLVERRLQDECFDDDY